jgi:hypothetical protein
MILYKNILNHYYFLYVYMSENRLTLVTDEIEKYSDNYIVNERHYRVEKKWDIANTTTIVDWINTANLYILLLDTYLKHLKRILRVNTLWSLLISSVTSTISITQFTITENQHPELSFVIKAIIFVTSLFTSLITGYIKVEKIQEKIEQVTSDREKWMKFMNTLTNELQVSSKLRNDAEMIIKSHREYFNNLTFKRIDVPNVIQENVSFFITSRAKKYITRNRRCSLWCSCCTSNSHMKEFVKLTQQQLSTFIMTRNLLSDELRLLSKVYNKIIKSITFKTHTELLKYNITTKSVRLKENIEKGLLHYSPVSSDDEDNDEKEDDNLSINTNSDNNSVRTIIHIDSQNVATNDVYKRRKERIRNIKNIVNDTVEPHINLNIKPANMELVQVIGNNETMDTDNTHEDTSEHNNSESSEVVDESGINKEEETNKETTQVSTEKKALNEDGDGDGLSNNDNTDDKPPDDST